MQLAGQKQGVVLQRIILARWCFRQDGAAGNGRDELSECQDGDSEYGSVTTEGCTMCYLWARAKVQQYQERLAELGNGWPVSRCMDVPAGEQYGLEVGAHLLCYTCQSIDTIGARA